MPQVGTKSAGVLVDRVWGVLVDRVWWQLDAMCGWHWPSGPDGTQWPAADGCKSNSVCAHLMMHTQHHSYNCTSYNSGLLKINYNKNSQPWPRLKATLWHGLPTMHSAECLFIDQLINTCFHTRYIQWTIVKAHYIIIIIDAYATWDIYAWISQADHSIFFQVQWGHICLCQFPRNFHQVCHWQCLWTLLSLILVTGPVSNPC